MLLVEMSKPEDSSFSQPSGPVRPSDYLRVQEDDREGPEEPKGQQQKQPEVGLEVNKVEQELDIEDKEQQEALVGRLILGVVIYIRGGAISHLPNE